MNEKTLGQNTDFTVTFPADMTNAGEKELTFIGMGNYTGTAEVAYRIERAPIGAPVITAPTAAQTVTVVEGETGTMTVTATEAEKYQWYIDRNDGKGYVAMEGATAASYTTSKVNTDNDGFTYYCQVSNAYGESKSPVFTLKVKTEVDVPQTGDEAQLGLWLALMVLSLGGMADVVMNCKRRENETTKQGRTAEKPSAQSIHIP